MVFFRAHLCNAHGSPFLLPQELQSAFRLIVVVGGNGLEHSLGQLDVAVLVFTIGIAIGTSGRVSSRTVESSLKVRKGVPSRIVNRVDELLEARTLVIRQRPRAGVAATGVDAHLLW